MQHHRYGLSRAGVVIGICVVGVTALVVAYFISDPFRTKADQAYKEFAEWTPENIAKDPLNYLNFCEAETTKALVDLKATEISIAQRRAKLQGMQDSAEQKIASVHRLWTSSSPPTRWPKQTPHGRLHGQVKSELKTGPNVRS